MSAILVALRDRPHSLSKQPLLDLLEEIDYVQRDARGLYHLRVPVFTERDKPMIDRTLALSRKIMKEWFAAHHAELRRDLASLTGIRNGLTFEELFTQVWHEIFGAVTRELIRSKLVADPYAPDARSKGSFSAVWHSTLYALTPG